MGNDELVRGGLNFKGHAIVTAQDVDRVTTAFILGETGGVHEELKNLRRGLHCLFVLMRGNQADELAKAAATGDELLALHEKIEQLVADGKDFKLRYGLR